MTYKCFTCGWSDKPSHKKYYQKKGLCRPVCNVCNPPLPQKIRNRVYRFISWSFSYGPRVAPLATFPYLPLVLIVTALSIDFAPKNLADLIGIIVFLTSYICIGLASMKVGDLISAKIIRGESFAKLVLLFYLPLIVIGLILFIYYQLIVVHSLAFV